LPWLNENVWNVPCKRQSVIHDWDGDWEKKGREMVSVEWNAFAALA